MQNKTSLKSLKSLKSYMLDFSPCGVFDPQEPIDVSFHTPNAENIYSLHYHDGIELGFCYEGGGTFIIDGEVIPYTAPAATVIYPEQFHKANSLKGNESRWIFITFKPEQLFCGFDRYQMNLLCSLCNSNAQCQSINQSLLTEENDKNAMLLFKALVGEISERSKNHIEIIKGIIWSILAAQKILQSEESKPEKQSDRQAVNRIGPIINYINQEYRSSLTVKQVASAFFITETTLRRWFLSSLGVSPLDYIHRVCISNAASLLLGTQQSVLDISMECGYQSQSSFNRQFFKEYGCTPLTYRKKGWS